ncbi:MAG: NRDE family protein [Chitinophagaceae bacterium]|nr:NRDE family protein [Chitinophagaceae bacterium]
MCTVSFVPAGNRKFILTSNRDETTQRGLATAPQRFLYKGVEIICPQDPLAHGSWIAASENHRLTCLLNGAFKKHKRRLPYRESRGIVVLDSLTYDSPEDFIAAYDFSNIEPFTMVLVNSREKIRLHELRWDGSETHFKLLSENEWHLWSSATLYSDELIAEKEHAFKTYLEALTEVSVQALIDIHKNHFLYEDLVLLPEKVTEVATLSVTGVECNPDKFFMHYRDLVSKELPIASLSI